MYSLNFCFFCSLFHLNLTFSSTLASNIIELTFQIQNFVIAFKSRYSSNEIKKIVHDITFVIARSIWSIVDKKVITRQINRAQSLKQTSYSKSWIIDKFVFKKICKILLVKFVKYRRETKSFVTTSFVFVTSLVSTSSLDSSTSFVSMFFASTRSRNSSTNSLTILRRRHFISKLFSQIVTILSRISSLSIHRINLSSFIESSNTINIMRKTFFETQMTTLRVMIAKVVQFSTNVQQSITITNSSNRSQEKQWNLNLIDFFDSMYDNKSTIIDDSIDNVDKKTYYRDVNLFIDKIKNIIEIDDSNVFKQNLWICLRDIVFTWWIFELINVEKQLIKFENNVDYWVQLLFTRWKKRSNKTISIVFKKKYNMQNARANKKSREYAQIMLRVERFVELSIYNQLLTIYNNINIEFKREIFKLESNTIINSFLTLLKNKKKIK